MIWFDKYALRQVNHAMPSAKIENRAMVVDAIRVGAGS
jgi:hypothetical protein